MDPEESGENFYPGGKKGGVANHRPQLSREAHYT